MNYVNLRVSPHPNKKIQGARLAPTTKHFLPVSKTSPVQKLLKCAQRGKSIVRGLPEVSLAASMP